jgi:hypothetical protein
MGGGTGRGEGPADWNMFSSDSFFTFEKRWSQLRPEDIHRRSIMDGAGWSDVNVEFPLGRKSTQRVCRLGLEDSG